MENDYIVYMFTCPKNKNYIGITNNFQARMRQHKNSQSCKALADAIKTFGFDKLRIKKIHEGLTKEEALIIEQAMIRSLNTQFPNGYNIISKHGEKIKYKPKQSIDGSFDAAKRLIEKRLPYLLVNREFYFDNDGNKKIRYFTNSKNSGSEVFYSIDELHNILEYF